MEIMEYMGYTLPIPILATRIHIQEFGRIIFILSYIRFLALISHFLKVQNKMFKKTTKTATFFETWIICYLTGVLLKFHKIV